MKITPEYVEMIIELAREVESEDPIDWGMLAIDEDNAYRLMTLNLLEEIADKYSQPEFKDIMIATVVKLVVENFCLNLQLKGRHYNP